MVRLRMYMLFNIDFWILYDFKMGLITLLF
jgi:hypothetical protein